MGILSKLRQIVLEEQGFEKDQLSRLRKLPKEESTAELGSIFHDRCMKAPVEIVQRKLAPLDSPFRELPKTGFFHEMLELMFWIFESLFDGKKKLVIDAMYRTYSSSFTWRWQSSHKELLNLIWEIPSVSKQL